ncbi:lysophospholipid acyltransferase family protein [uncultured Hyphomonas sp.]|uniref:lysophospholipid acyltransferase family protein n=1 Tax=uncultured Hyphomonas sp. TaxID=225298 RepID=UPI0026254499|nr:lysophospholipid acyltransferase family protein [uncultured Hyphomonas sp.]
MKSLLRHPFVSSLLGYLIWGYMVICARTIRWTVEGETGFRKAWTDGDGLIVAAWHSRVLLLPTIWSRIARKLPGKAYQTAMLISMSRDGEAVAKAVSHLGLETVRGSSAHKRKKKNKGGVAAIAETSRRLRAGSVVCVTPDGPRGPAEEVQPGAILLAQRSGARVIPYALDCKPVFRLDTWDRFMIPLPFSRGAMIIGEPMAIARDATREEAAHQLGAQMKLLPQRAAELVGQS